MNHWIWINAIIWELLGKKKQDYWYHWIISMPFSIEFMCFGTNASYVTIHRERLHSLKATICSETIISSQFRSEEINLFNTVIFAHRFYHGKKGGLLWQKIRNKKEWGQTQICNKTIVWIYLTKITLGQHYNKQFHFAICAAIACRMLLLIEFWNISQISRRIVADNK